MASGLGVKAEAICDILRLDLQRNLLARHVLKECTSSSIPVLPVQAFLKLGCSCCQVLQFCISSCRFPVLFGTWLMLVRHHLGKLSSTMLLHIVGCDRPYSLFWCFDGEESVDKQTFLLNFQFFFGASSNPQGTSKTRRFSGRGDNSGNLQECLRISRRMLQSKRTDRCLHRVVQPSYFNEFIY